MLNTMSPGITSNITNIYLGDNLDNTKNNYLRSVDPICSRRKVAIR